MELPAKLLHYFLRSNKSNNNQGRSPPLTPLDSWGARLRSGSLMTLIDIYPLDEILPLINTLYYYKRYLSSETLQRLENPTETA